MSISEPLELSILYYIIIKLNSFDILFWTHVLHHVAWFYTDAVCILWRILAFWFAFLLAQHSRAAVAELTTDGLLGKIFDIHILIWCQFLQHWFHLCLQAAVIKTSGGHDSEASHIKRKVIYFYFWPNVDDHIPAVQHRSNLLKRLGHIEANIGYLVVGHLQNYREHVFGGNLLPTHLRQSLKQTVSHISTATGIMRSVPKRWQRSRASSANFWCQGLIQKINYRCILINFMSLTRLKFS